MRNLSSFALSMFMGMAACSTTSTAPTAPDGGLKMTDTADDTADNRSDAGTAALASDAGECPEGPKTSVGNGQLKDEGRGFEFAIPPGFAAKARNCGLYPTLEQITPEANRQPQRVDIYVTETAFQPRDFARSVNPAGVAYFLIPGRGQETGQVTEWNLVIPAAAWFLTFQTGAEGKATVEQIAAAFRWTR